MRITRIENLRVAFVIAGLLAMTACSRPSRISATLDITRRTSDSVLVRLQIVNLEDRATTPIAPEVITQTRSGTTWDRPITSIQPAAFVLNKKERRDIFKVLHTDANLVRATLTIKEQETGHILMTKRIQVSVAAISPPPVPSTSDPATPPPPDK